MLDEFRSTLITWDKATSRIYSPVTANASDENGRKLVVQIVNSGQVEDLTGATLHLYWETKDKAHDGLDVFEAVDLKKGEFELSYTTGMLSNQGVLNANLVLIDTVGRVVSERFKITVTEGIDNDAIQSENSFTTLTQALIDISNLEQNYAPRLNDLTAQLQQTNELRINSYITPYDFGAIGDGEADDTEALREALYVSESLGTVLFFPSGCKCKVTAPLNYRNDQYHGITLNIKGSLPDAKGEYALSSHGGIKLNAETALFKNGSIRGSINNMSIVGSRNENYYFFDNCELIRFNMEGNNVTNFGAFLYDSGMQGVTRINNNFFLTVYYFHKHNVQGKGMIDSFITNNYINGGAEPSDNACFEFINGNGSVIQGNFIDYYHTIFRTHVSSTNQVPTSIGNQYQVFLYFYDFHGAGSVSFNSIGDTFNWTAKSTLEHLNKYKEKNYTAENGAIYAIPTYIYRPRESSQISIEKGYIQSNVGNIVYLDHSPAAYERSYSNASFIGLDRHSKNRVSLIQGKEKPFYNAGNYLEKSIEPYFIVDVEELPTTSLGWVKYPSGMRVRYNKQNYRLINKYNQTESKWESKWIETDGI